MPPPIYLVSNSTEDVNVLLDRLDSGIRLGADTLHIALRNSLETTKSKIASKVAQLITHPLTEITTLVLWDHDGTSLLGCPHHFCLEPIAQALMHPNNQITNVRLSGVGITRQTVHLIAESLQSPRTKLKVLELSGCNTDICLVSRALRSEHCKLQKLKINWPLSRCGKRRMTNPFCLDGVVAAMFESMLASTSRLEDVSVEGWGQIAISGASEVAKRVMDKPGNSLKSLSFHLSALGSQDLLYLLSGAQGETNVLESLNLSHCNVGSQMVPNLIKTITGPNSKLRSLFLSGTYLTFGDWTLILDALQSSSGNRIECLQLGTIVYLGNDLKKEPQLQTFLVAAGAFLKSQNCRLNRLQLDFGTESEFLNAELAKYLLPTVRSSSLQTLWITPFQDKTTAWSNALDSRWFRVLVTLLSVKQVPRLCPEAACRAVPFNNFFADIAETLGWRIEDLAGLTNDEDEDSDDDLFDDEFDDDDEDEDDADEDEDEEPVPCFCRNVEEE